MKILTKLIACAAVLGAVAAAAADRFEFAVTVPAGATTAVVTQKLVRADGAPCSTIDSVFATASSGSGTGSVAIAQYDYGTATTIATLTDIRSGTSGYARPCVALTTPYTYTVVDNVVTGNYAYTVSTLQTKSAAAVAQYVARQLRVTVTQTAVASDTIYAVVVYVKEDPPPQIR